MKALYLLLCLSFLSCCGTKPLPPIPGNVKVYSIQEQKGGLVRVQANEVKPFSEAKGYLCLSPQHMEDTVSCVGGSVRVYSLQPQMNGIYRKQANDLMTYREAKNYLCTSPKDFGYILDKCQ